jgi:predicted membrane protein
MLKTTSKDPFVILGVVIGAIAIVGASLLFEALVLGLILSWFNVYLAFWQNLVIVLLANAIFKSSSN